MLCHRRRKEPGWEPGPLDSTPCASKYPVTCTSYKRPGPGAAVPSTGQDTPSWGCDWGGSPAAWLWLRLPFPPLPRPLWANPHTRLSYPGVLLARDWSSDTCCHSPFTLTWGFSSQVLPSWPCSRGSLTYLLSLDKSTGLHDSSRRYHVITWPFA